jgi:hypothetical protein
MASILPVLLAHWPFIAVWVISMIVFQVVNKNVFPRGGVGTLQVWGRKTHALQPIIVGALVGLVWRNPDPLVTNLAAGIAYFSLSGALSTSSYEVLKGLLARQGIDISLDGVDSSILPPPPNLPKV